jgi:UTP:GlnB (protein PII) uridylyltransferase
MTSNPADALRGQLPDFYFVNASAAQIEHHNALISRLPQEKRIIEFLRPPGTFLSDLSLCAYDDARPGLLAKICGALATLKVKVHTASVFTLRDGKPIILDTLQISDSYLGHDRRLAGAKEKEIRATLEKLLGGSFAPGQMFKMPLLRRPLKVLDVTLEKAPQGEQKVITIRTTKNPLAVFRMAAAMASLEFDIQAAQIHQNADEVQGIFFVTGQYTDNLDYQLRFELQSNRLPTILSNA